MAGVERSMVKKDKVSGRRVKWQTRKHVDIWPWGRGMAWRNLDVRTEFEPPRAIYLRIRCSFVHTEQSLANVSVRFADRHAWRARDQSQKDLLQPENASSVCLFVSSPS